MNPSKVVSLVGMDIIGQHGREVGVITDMCADLETWQLQSLEVISFSNALWKSRFFAFLFI